MPSMHHGLLVLNKPAGISSRRAVDVAAQWFPRQTSIGHTGTLDPFACGVLVLCVGVATRLAEHVQELEKVYEARFFLGARSETDDVEGPIRKSENPQPPDLPSIQTVISAFIGTIEQVPPRFSAVKSNGVRAYKLARAGKNNVLSPRPVVIHEMHVLNYAYPHLDLRIRCRSGTYIRSLARDIGERLTCGAYVHSLVRRSVGWFNLDDAVWLNFEERWALSQLQPPSAAVKDLPAIRPEAAELVRLIQGQAIPAHELAPSDAWNRYPLTAVFDGEKLVAIAEWMPETNHIRPRKVLKY